MELHITRYMLLLVLSGLLGLWCIHLELELLATICILIQGIALGLMFKSM